MIEWTYAEGDSDVGGDLIHNEQVRRTVSELAEHIWRESAAMRTPGLTARAAAAYLSDPAPASSVLVVVVAGDPPLPAPSVLQALARLTAREAQVASLIASGYPDKKVAKELGVSRYTVSRHAEKVRQKLSVSGRRDVREALLRLVRKH